MNSYDYEFISLETYAIIPVLDSLYFHKLNFGRVLGLTYARHVMIKNLKCTKSRGSAVKGKLLFLHMNSYDI